MPLVTVDFTKVRLLPNQSITPERRDSEIDAFFSAKGLRATWKVLRREIRQLSARDALDWVDWVVTVDASINELRRDLLEGCYVPTPPTRFEAGKGGGSYRVITSLNIRDALVYRHICDEALRRAVPSKVKGAFFSRTKTATPIGETFAVGEEPSPTFFEVWMRYNEYRTITLLNSPYRVLVTADISNYFDSIQHDLLFEYLAPLGLPRKAVGLLGKLLETFRPASGHSPTPRIGLPVDEFDCSRQLAHVFLFEHDVRVVERVGEENYVRWMDDQNVGVDSVTAARQVANILTRSLAQQRLTLSAAKTRFLSPSEVAIHFQLEPNKALNDWERRGRRGAGVTADDLNAFREVWQRIESGGTAGFGNWDKVLKRAYAIATRLDIDVLEGRAEEDLILYPHLAELIFNYFAKRNRAAQVLTLFRDYAQSGENLFELTEAQFFESALLLDAPPRVAHAFRALARSFAEGTFRGQTGRPLARAASILCLYWFGEPIDDLHTLFAPVSARNLPKEVARAWLAVVGARSPNVLGDVVGALFGHAADDVARLARFLGEINRGTLGTLGPYRNARSRWPLRGKFYDARTWLLLEIASQSPNPHLRTIVKRDLTHFAKLASTRSERAVLTRVRRRADKTSAVSAQ